MDQRSASVPSSASVVPVSAPRRWRQQIAAHPARVAPARSIKRAIDVVLSIAGVILLSPVFLFAALLVRLSSPGPILFKHVRIGLDLEPFAMIKFRTMVVDAEARRQSLAGLNDAKGIVFKIRDDPRTIRFGGFLRRTSLDELPQLFNVLRGDMSLVGPRPLAPWIVDEADDDRFYRRFTVLPGMTGQWQVGGREQDSRKMLDQDLAYVDGWSFRRDAWILATTVVAVFRDKGV